MCGVLDGDGDGLYGLFVDLFCSGRQMMMFFLLLHFGLIVPIKRYPSWEPVYFAKFISKLGI